MHSVILPKIEPNMEEAMITEWIKKEGEYVQKGEILFTMETAKAVIEIEAEVSGYLKKIVIEPGKIVPVLAVVAFMGEKDEPLTEKWPEKELNQQPTINNNNNNEKKNDNNSKDNNDKNKPVVESKIVDTHRNKATPAARRVAQEHHINIELVTGTGPEGMIVEEDVRRHLQSLDKTQSLKEAPIRRIIIIGAGNGGEVVGSILLQKAENEVVGFLDDKESLWGQTLLKRPILGKIELVHELFNSGKANAVIISITSNMKVRKKIFDMLQEHRYTIMNAIHPQAYVDPSVHMGTGNIVGAFVYIGYGAAIGKNNLITAHCNIEHHNRIGSHILFGPGVMTSGDVTINDECSLGAGVNIEPHVKIGNNVAIASGTTIISDVPSFTIMKKEMKH